MKIRTVVFLLVASFSAGGAAVGLWAYNKLKKTRENRDKLLNYYGILNSWVALKQQGRSVSEFFQKHSCHTIAIYGAKELGERLYDELKQSDVEVLYIIDKNVRQFREGVEVKYPKRGLPEVDMIVITADYYFAQIERVLREVADCPVYSLGDILCEL